MLFEQLRAREAVSKFFSERSTGAKLVAVLLCRLGNVEIKNGLAKNVLAEYEKQLPLVFAKNGQTETLNELLTSMELVCSYEQADFSA